MRLNLFKKFLLWPSVGHFDILTTLYLLTIINNQFYSYVDSIYFNELKIKDTTECCASASYLDVLLKLDTNGKITTQPYDKRDDFNFSIVNFPYIPASPAYGVYISQLIRYARVCSTYNQFLVRGSLLINKLMSQGFQLSRLQTAFRNFMVVTTILFAHTTFRLTTCCLIFFIPIVQPFLTHWSWLRVVPFIWSGGGAHGGCDQSTGDTYSSMASDSTSGFSRGPCKPDFYCGVFNYLNWTPD
jgi:hypothetical protein